MLALALFCDTPREVKRRPTLSRAAAGAGFAAAGGERGVLLAAVIACELSWLWFLQ